MSLAQSYLTLCDPMDCSLSGSSGHGTPQARILECVAIPFSRDLPNSGISPECPALQADSLLSESPGKPRNTGVGSLALLQGIFLTQESNQGLLHYRQILYQLSYQGSPRYKRWFMGKESACNAEDLGSIPGLGRCPGRELLPTPVFRPEESHGKRSLVGYSPWGPK